MSRGCCGGCCCSSCENGKCGGLFAGMLLYLMTLATGVVLITLHYYYCAAICIASLITYLIFMAGAIKRGNSRTVTPLLIFGIVMEVVYLIYLCLFATYIKNPQAGPFCKCHNGPMEHEDYAFCDSACSHGGGYIALVAIFAVLLFVDALCLMMLRRYQRKLQRFEQACSRVCQTSSEQVATVQPGYQYPAYTPSFQVITSPTALPQQTVAPNTVVLLVPQAAGIYTANPGVLPPPYPGTTSEEGGTRNIMPLNPADLKN